MHMPFFHPSPPAEFLANLATGPRMRVQAVRPEHAPLFVSGYEKLSSHSRRMRFFGQTTGISSKQLEFLTSPDGKNHLAYAAQVCDSAEPVGVARCIRLDGDSRIAEVALTVLDDYQGMGVGLLLHATLHIAARGVGIRQFIYDISSENTRFINHLQALGADTINRDREVCRLTLPALGSARDVQANTATAQQLKQRLQELADL